MNPRTARWLAWSLVGLYIVLVTIGLTFIVLTRKSYADYGFLYSIGLSLAIGISSLIGAIIVSRLPRNPIGWILVGVLSIIWGMEVLSDGYSYYGLVAYPGSLPGSEIALIWRTSQVSRFAIVGLTLMFLWFPNGRLVSPRWSKAAWIALGATALYVPLAALEPGPLEDLSGLVNPIGISESAWAVLNPIKVMAGVLATLCLLAAAVSLIIRLRRARGDERQQLKWFTFAGAFFPVAFLILVYGGSELLPVGYALQFLSIAGMAIATAIAILRYRLYDIDIIINRTLVYGALSAALLLVYLLSVLVFQNLLRTLTSQESPIAVVASTLLVAAFFQPLRRRIQGFIDRRFFRRKYDASQILSSFGAQLRDEIELDELASKMLKVVEDSVQPKHVSLWLRTETSRLKRDLPKHSEYGVNSQEHG